MRLINAHTLELLTFGDRPPPYAILSHRWGDEELSLQDFQDPRRRRRGAGYRKIQYFCSVVSSAITLPLSGPYADEHTTQLEWAWVDTVCIDKTSSSELSESINSMWKYYEEAVYCIAYLADVPPLADEEKLLRSKWFTRGWTLQELIAPRTVLFFDQAWRRLGSKNRASGLGPTIAAASGIDLPFLTRSRDIRDTSVAQRMSWASRRTTTREEDLAYCLMGLFGVNMPLLYGEGGEKAFRRLQGEIIRQSDDESILAFFGDREDEWTGILADSPSAFRKSGTVVRKSRVHRPPFTVTNRGLHIEGPAIHISGRLGNWDCYILKLNCVLQLPSHTAGVNRIRRAVGRENEDERRARVEYSARLEQAADSKDHQDERRYLRGDRERPRRGDNRTTPTDAIFARGCILALKREKDTYVRFPPLERTVAKISADDVEICLTNGRWTQLENRRFYVELSAERPSWRGMESTYDRRVECLDREGPWFSGIEGDEWP